MTSVLWPLSIAAKKIKNFPKKPAVNGRPASDAMAMSMAKARNGARLAKPSKTEISSLVCRATIIKTAKLRSVISRYATR